MVPVPDRQGRPVKVLVADDDRVARLVAQGVVESLGHECSLADDGAAAWRLFRTDPPDVLVTDWRMPGLDGLELCRAVRESEQDRYTYIVLLTALSAHDEILSGIQAGADDYLVKPLDPFAMHVRLIVAERVTALHAHLSTYRAELARSAQTDPLTGLFNRRKLGDDLAALHARSTRYARPYSVAICDIDFFKRYNDTHGHQAGDDALRAVAEALRGASRQADTVYRYGGEEFVLLLPEVELPQAVHALERLRRVVEAARIGAGHGHDPLTVSAGVATFDPARPVTAETLLSLADDALYRAKAAGRNAVVAHSA